MPDAHGNLAQPPTGFPVDRVHVEAMGTRQRAKRLGRLVRGHGNSLEESWSEELNDGASATDVIGIAMCQQQRVEPTDTLTPHRRCDNPRAEIEARWSAKAPRINQQRRRVRKLDQGRVTLPDVDADDGEPAVRSPGPTPDVRSEQDPHCSRSQD